MQCVNAAGHQAFAAELTSEIGLALEQGYVDAAASDQVGQCGACRAGADDREARHLSASPPSRKAPPVAGRPRAESKRCGARYRAESHVKVQHRAGINPSAEAALTVR